MARTVPFIPREYLRAKNSLELVMATRDTLAAIRAYKDEGVVHGHITPMSIMHVDQPEGGSAAGDQFNFKGILLDLDDSNEFYIPDKQTKPTKSSPQPEKTDEVLPILPVD